MSSKKETFLPQLKKVKWIASTLVVKHKIANSYDNEMKMNEFLCSYGILFPCPLKYFLVKGDSFYFELRNLFSKLF